jgi:hypothetical protein
MAQGHLRERTPRHLLRCLGGHDVASDHEVSGNARYVEHPLRLEGPEATRSATPSSPDMWQAPLSRPSEPDVLAWQDGAKWLPSRLAGGHDYANQHDRLASAV